ncbi:MAG: gliding motility-associated C-terminal domain-containing protein [Prevotellaceae bacterium]|nr:gliding motility-associated C-terminal domain-containing protein [Prevotellaceae bacterium]
MKRCICIFILILCCETVKAQHTTQGRDFWVSFGDNVSDNFFSLTFQIRVVTVKATSVTFTFTNLGISSSVSLEAGTVYTRNLSQIEKLSVYSNLTEKSDKSLHIESDEDISVYAINLAERSTDATAVLPVKSLGNSYYHMSYAPVSSAVDGYILIATENATKISENGIYRTTLNRGEVYTQYFEYDATGKHITADRPVACFTANSCVFVPEGVMACDCLYEQLFPETAWGTSFMVPVTMRGKERVRVLASQNGTKITHVGGTLVSGSTDLDAGEYLEIEISRKGVDENGICYDGCYISANNPVAVASYLTGLEYDNLVYNGDPAMTWIPSIEQSVNELLLAPFIASGSSMLAEHHVLIVTPAADKQLTETSIGNGEYTPLSDGSWTDHVSGYSFYSMPLTVGNLSYRFRNPGGITVLGYGLGFRESYYYLSGSATRKLNAAFYVNDIHHQDLDGREFCSDNFDIKAVVRYEMHPGPGHLRWIVDGKEEVAVEDLLHWSKTFSEDTHTVSMIVKDVENDTDTLNVVLTVKIQKLDVVDAEVCEGQSIELKVNNSSDELIYRWYSDAAFSGFIQQGTSVTASLRSDSVFYVEAISNIGCRIRDSIRASLHSAPDLSTEDIDICLNSAAGLKASSADAVSLKWYRDAGFSDFIASDFFETSKLISDTVFYVEALSAKGCTARDTLKVNVYNPKTNDLSICYGATATLLAPADGVASQTWYRNPDYSGVITGDVSFETGKIVTDTVFYLETLSTKGCIAKSPVKVSIDHLPALVVGDTSICAGTPVTLSVMTDAGSLKWYVDAAYSIPVNQTVSYSTVLSSDTVFYVEAFSNEICSIRDSIRVSVSQLPSVTAPDDMYLCYGEEVTLDVLQSEGLVNWNVHPLTFIPESTREYVVTASRPPCPDASDKVVIAVGDSLWIRPSVLPPYQTAASYSAQLITNAESPDFTILKGELPFGLYLSRTGEISGVPNDDDSACYFTVRIEDGHHCAIAQEYTVERDFHVPKIFTPNGDGINDIFMKGYEVSVFDRLGIEIFRGDDGWNGTYHSQPAPRSIYFYILKRPLENGEIRKYTGYVGIQ